MGASVAVVAAARAELVGARATSADAGDMFTSARSMSTNNPDRGRFDHEVSAVT